MIWNDEVKQWLIANMNEYRNTNGRLSIGKLEDAVVEQFDQPMDQGEFIRWTEENKVKQCDGIKRLKKRLAKHKSKPVKLTYKMINKAKENLSAEALEKERLNQVTLSSSGQTVNLNFNNPTKSNIEYLDWNGKTYILLSDCLKLLNIRS